jgi:spermidine synthase
MNSKLSLRTQRPVLFALTFIVAFCSIVYELIYSELLRVIYGGTVVRYSITIGLFLFSFGIGSLLFNYLDEDRENFFRIEVLLAVGGPLGLVFIILLNSFPSVEFFLKGDITLVASHLPIVVVGALSGLEVPYLTSMVESKRNAFSEVLGIDYIGSLAGTVVYALVLYPTLGLIPSIFVLGLLNAVAALAFSVGFSSSSRVLLAVCIVVSGAYVGALASSGAVETRLTNMYIEGQIESEYPSGQMEVDVVNEITTRYQDAVVYNRRWTGPSSEWEGANGTTKCLRLDMALQLCESWVDSYHNGLVDVPATFFKNFSNKEVLLIGGGDWIPVNQLRKYNVSVDQVDIDGQFQEYAKNSSFLSRFHEGAYKYDKLNTTIADAFTYLRNHDEKYDLILLDLPGIRSDDLLNLYSKEFYTYLRQSLTDQGLLVTWGYSRYSFPAHYKTHMNTIRAAGFESYISYSAYDDLDSDGDPERAEGFYVFSPGGTPQLHINRSQSEYIQRYADRYRQLEWRSVPHYQGIEVNSIFDPNYKIIIDYE